MDITHDFGPFSARLQAAPALVQREMVTATNRLTIQGETFAKDNLTANGSVVSGTLRRGVTHQPATFAGGTVTGRYGTAVPYGPMVERGRRGFSAGPGKVLRFRPKGGGGYIYRKSVGPAAARPFIRPSVDRLRPLVQREYGAALQRVVAQLDGS